jgi:hypothetical protein
VCVVFFVSRGIWVEGFGDGCAAGGDWVSVLLEMGLLVGMVEVRR